MHRYHRKETCSDTRVTPNHPDTRHKSGGCAEEPSRRPYHQRGVTSSLFLSPLSMYLGSKATSERVPPSRVARCCVFEHSRSGSRPLPARTQEVVRFRRQQAGLDSTRPSTCTAPYGGRSAPERDGAVCHTMCRMCQMRCRCIGTRSFTRLNTQKKLNEDRVR